MSSTAQPWSVTRQLAFGKDMEPYNSGSCDNYCSYNKAVKILIIIATFGGILVTMYFWTKNKEIDAKLRTRYDAGNLSSF